MVPGIQVPDSDGELLSEQPGYDMPRRGSPAHLRQHPDAALCWVTARAFPKEATQTRVTCEIRMPGLRRNLSPNPLYPTRSQPAEPLE